MRIVLQKVSDASITIDPDAQLPETLDFNAKALSERSIEHGFVLLVGVEDADTDKDVAWTAKKIANMRIFEDENGKMNRSLLDVNGSILSVSQFTLYANICKGNRPGFTEAGAPDYAHKLWKHFNATLEQEYGIEVKTGIFGAHMHASLTNDGPVTIIVDSAIMRG
ncbi:D-aminoacyl-tRNA deacylase [Alloscardovia sp. HMSC034E08]|uniref:D-aminoacyl-tRNA deacylase n=1 Tax=Alloscardovia sp. HMSC034E08 TaxID=1739413 RepID=UPI0008CF2E27|nr:D-aminoacyl-tRNA deacylase [Alloscardovia sp. HMSC034E08]OFQ99758.1 D-tyrosyl-tRNA(Tyr) deacylase [Alloscardovia sp. HMSC034E08]